MNTEAESWRIPMPIVRNFIKNMELEGSINGEHKLVGKNVSVSLYKITVFALIARIKITVVINVLPMKYLFLTFRQSGNITIISLQPEIKNKLAVFVTENKTEKIKIM